MDPKINGVKLRHKIESSLITSYIYLPYDHEVVSWTFCNLNQTGRRRPVGPRSLSANIFPPRPPSPIKVRMSTFNFIVLHMFVNIFTSGHAISNPGPDQEGGSMCHSSKGYHLYDGKSHKKPYTTSKNKSRAFFFFNLHA